MRAAVQVIAANETQLRRFRPNAAYHDSGVGWLQNVPTDWQQKRLKFCVHVINQKVEAAQSNATYVGLESIESNTGRLLPAPAEQTCDGLSNLFEPDDVLFGKLRPYLAKALHAQERGLCSSELLVLRPRVVAPRFLFYYVISPDFVRIVDSSTYGAKMPRASWNFIGNLPLLIPAEAEQHAIAAFLDRETARIDALIGKKTRLIELLQEKRAALISHAVTKGLNPNASMRDSGVPWLEMVPTNWKLERLKFRYRCIEQGWSPQCENRTTEPGEWGVLKVGCMNTGNYSESENKALPANLDPILHYEINVGDLLMSRSNTVELVGSVGRVHATQGRIMLCDKLYRIALDARKLNLEYAVYLLRSRAARFQIERDATGASASMKNISNDRVGNLVLAFPDLSEQGRIVTYLDAACRKISQVDSAIRSAVDTLREYRSALISAAVTGKIDVRDRA